MYVIVSSALAGIGPRERSESLGPEKVIQEFGAHEWLIRDPVRLRENPKESNTGVVKVWVFVRIWSEQQPRKGQFCLHW